VKETGTDKAGIADWIIEKARKTPADEVARGYNIRKEALL
jgi:hypothetical protein